MDVLNDQLRQQHAPQVDVATAYFSIRGFARLSETLLGARHVRLLLGDELQMIVANTLMLNSVAFARAHLLVYDIIGSVFHRAPGRARDHTSPISLCQRVG